jgi:hypothetical protein
MSFDSFSYAVWFAGGRDLSADWVPWIQWALSKLPVDKTIIGVGCAKGADHMVARLAHKAGFVVEIACAWPQDKAPQWVRRADSAGVGVRYSCGKGKTAREILSSRTKYVCDKVSSHKNPTLIAIPGGPGTKLSINLAKKAGIRVRIIGSPEIPTESGEGVPPFIPDWPEAPGLDSYPDRYLISRAQILFHGQNPLAPGSAFKIPDKPAPRKEFKLPLIRRETIPKSYNRIFTCKCGWTQEFGTVQGRCSCWMCSETYNPLPQFVDDELFVSAMSLMDHETDQHRAIADDTQQMGWPEFPGTSSDPLSRPYLQDNDKDTLSLVMHDLWGEYSGQDYSDDYQAAMSLIDDYTKDDLAA